MNTFSTRTRRGAAILFSGVLVIGGLTLTGEATAGQDVAGNPTCSDLGYTHTYKVESPSAGTYTVDRDGMTAGLTVGTHADHTDPNPNNAIVGHDISTSAAGYAVVVKGGPGAIVYRSNSDGSLQAPPLHAPAVPSGKWPTISHFQLCWNEPVPPPGPGRIEVTKVVTGDGAPAGDDYEICLEGPAPSTEQQCTTITGRGTTTFENLQPGEYVVIETDPGPNYTVDGSGDTIVVQSEATATATVTNTWNAPTEEFGRVEVTKVVTGEGAPADDPYEICLTGPTPATTTTCTTIVGAHTATFEGLVPGTYEVTETDHGADYEVTIADATVEVTIGETTTATVTNEFVQQQSLPPTVPETPAVPETPTVPEAPTAATAPTEVASETSLPTTGSEGGIAVIATILVAAGVALMLLGRPRAPRELRRSSYQAISGRP